MIASTCRPKKKVKPAKLKPSDDSVLEESICSEIESDAKQYILKSKDAAADHPVKRKPCKKSKSKKSEKVEQVLLKHA